MKTATLPALRVAPELRESIEDILREGETLSSFIEEAVRGSVRRRRMNDAFLARGLQARENARKASEYYPAEDVLDELAQMLADAKESDAP